MYGTAERLLLNLVAFIAVVVLGGAVAWLFMSYVGFHLPLPVVIAGFAVVIGWHAVNGSETIGRLRRRHRRRALADP